MPDSPQPQGRVIATLVPLSLSPRLLRQSSAQQRAAEKRSESRLRWERLLFQSAAGTILEGSPAVYLLDVYQWGGFLRSGAIQQDGKRPLLWPEAGNALLESLEEGEDLRAVLEIDGFTLEELAAASPEIIGRLRETLASRRLELLGAAYAHPPAAPLSGEANLRQLYYGLAAGGGLGGGVGSYLLAESQLFPQLAQILRGFGAQRLVLLTSDAAISSEQSSQQRAPDGSLITAIRGYGPEPAVAPSGQKDGPANDPLGWDNERLDRFREAMRGAARPLLIRRHNLDSADGVGAPRAAVAAREDLQFVTARECFDAAAAGSSATDTSTAVDDSSWGLGGERLPREALEAEKTLLLAERLDALAYAMGRQSEEASLGSAWKEILRAQGYGRHAYDIAPSKRQGSPPEDAGRRLAFNARQTGRALAETAAAYLASHVDSSGLEGRGLVVFNPSSWARNEYIEITLGGEGYRIAQAGHEVPSQVVRRRKGYVTIGFVAHIPALGYRLFEVRPGLPAVAAEEAAAAAPRSFANSFYAAEIREDGSLHLEADGAALLEAGAHLTVRRGKRGYDSRDRAIGIETHDRGPVFDRYLLKGRLASIPFRQWLTFYKALPRIDLRTEMDFGQGAVFGPEPSTGEAEESRLCLNLQSPLRRPFADSPFFVGDVAGERAVALSIAGVDDEQERGIALLNRGTHGHHYDATTGVLKNVLAWAPKAAPLRRGHAFESAFLPFTSRLGALRAAVDYQIPCLGVLLTPHSGGLPPDGCFLSIGPAEALLSAMFVQEGRVYLRLWNAAAGEAAANVDSGSPLSLQACSFGLRDEPSAETTRLRPWGAQTFRLGGAQSS